ncbi:MAG: chromosome partitioning protein ParB, partial [Bacilli bacterium]|nr:chromosome partitioning protein ParB [Bacilli bacterium]
MELIAKVSGESREQVRRYIRLTYLIPELLKFVDDTVLYDKISILTLGITTAVELSYLSKEEQKLLLFAIEYDKITPNYAQALKIRKLSEKNKL